MKLVIKKAVARKVGYGVFIPFGVSRESWESWREEQVIDLGDLSVKQLDDLEAELTRFRRQRGVGVLLSDIQAWRKVLKGSAATMKARTVRQFETLLRQFLLKVPGHRIYKRHDEGAMLAYYVSKVEYHPPNNSREYRTPARVVMDLVYEEIGGKQESSATFYAEDCRLVPVARVLVDAGFQIENDELRKKYLADTKLFVKISGQVGKQYWGSGPAYSLVSRYGGNKGVQLDRDQEKSRVVIDVFHESTDDKPGRDNYVNLSNYFWDNVARKSGYDPESDEDNELEIDDDTTLKYDDIEVPIHPWIIVFHLQKHLRLRAHVAQLEEYIYDKKLSDKLVLPEDQKKLVKLLIDTKGGMFEDIVQGKGGGAVVLLTGAPGTGKTLTAEVYAESEQRPLYSVQCSQLGINPDDLEEALLKVFERARRWNAVMLLDEADVYVHERGNNMAQNAIVGVFLRVLEYQGTVLFLTSNRPEDVDDAIASRCIARLYYVAPGPEDARRIWRVLADNAKFKISDEVIEQFTTGNPGITGRDIKNILKLAGLMKGADKGITLSHIKYVQQFKPTGAVALQEPPPAEPGTLD